MRLRHNLAALTIAVAAVAPLSANAQEKSRTFTESEIKELIAKTLMEQPEIIIESVQQMQVAEQRNKAERARQVVQAYSSSLYKDKDSPKIGPENADVTVVEFFDYNCGYCKRSLATVQKLMDADKKVNFIFKENPMLAPNSVDAARASLAMYYLEPKHYFDYHNALFRLGGKFDEATLSSVAEGFGVDTDKFVKMMNSDRVKNHIDETQKLAARMGSQGVPVFIIGEEVIPGAVSYEALQQQVNAVRAAKKEEKS
ncbi:MAG: DsbA family protein [Alphaproteobacteria bacterium]|nr:DsbA family protein [Alphaproteobacteria bacterium]